MSKQIITVTYEFRPHAPEDWSARIGLVKFNMPEDIPEFLFQEGMETLLEREITNRVITALAPKKLLFRIGKLTIKENK